MKEVNFSKKINLISISSSQDDLWIRFHKGDRDALAQIYREYIDDLYHYGMHFCRDSDRVKDCLQDLFQDLWMGREHISDKVQNIRYYLLTSLRRKLLRSLKKERRYTTDTMRDIFDFIPPHEDTIIQREIRNEQLKKLKWNIASLSRRQREVVYLRYYQNLSYPEIATLMSMKVESVYNLTSKAISLLKKMFIPILMLIMSND